jgi:tetratricopeptide (TPR) repeat protein
MARDDKALPAYQQAEQIATDLDDHEALFIIWNNLGMILLEIGRFEEAAHLFWISVKTRLQLGKMEEIHEVYRNASLAFKRIAHDRVGNSSEKRYIISAYWLAIMFAKLAYDDRTEEQLFAHFKAVQLEN